MVAATASERKIASGDFFGCKDREHFEKLVRIIVQNDKEAFKKGLMAGLLRKQCTMFKEGETVFIADRAVFSGLAKLRRKGEMDEYWTNYEAVKEGKDKK